MWEPWLLREEAEADWQECSSRGIRSRSHADRMAAPRVSQSSIEQRRQLDKTIYCQIQRLRWRYFGRLGSHPGVRPTSRQWSASDTYRHSRQIVAGPIFQPGTPG